MTFAAHRLYLYFMSHSLCHQFRDKLQMWQPTLSEFDSESRRGRRDSARACRRATPAA